MKYLSTRNGWYVYKRHVPNFIKAYDSRDKIRIALNTKCEETALRRMRALNDEIEQYWSQLIETGKCHSSNKFKELVNLCKKLGFTYIPTLKLAEDDIIELVRRVLSLETSIDNQNIVQAVLGAEKPPKLKLSEALERFWDYSKPTLLDKTPDQQRKWKNPRVKAVNNFIKQVGDKDINTITNLDMLKLRDWWLKRKEKEDIRADTINKDFTHLKGVLDVVSTHEQLDINIEQIFKKINLKETDRQTRSPYSDDFIKNQILVPEVLNDLTEEAKCILYACIGTGARPIELLNLDGSNDILLDHKVPHIHIRPRKGYSLKTKESERKIPLVGLTLEAFKKFPNSFDRYQGKSDLFSQKINAFLSEKGLRPTPYHSLYSFRHSFQDRLTVYNIVDRIQCQLMGHSFKARGRVKYGNGGSLRLLMSVLKRISL